MTAAEEVADGDAARRPVLSRDEIIDAALDLIRHQGIGAVTMRRLADEIGVTPMALYHHIPSKKQLLDLAVDRVGEHVHIAHDGRPWIDQMRDYAMSWRAELHRFPGVAGYLLRQEAPPSMTWRVIDDAVSLLVESGFDERTAARAYAALASYVLARCDQEEIMARHARDNAPWSEERIRKLLVGAHDNVDHGRISGYLQELSHDDHFSYTLERLLVGIDADRGATDARPGRTSAD
ncbi:MAG: TetR/AcrR family transcriptional regulator [Acidimicrobiales bacterium]